MPLTEIRHRQSPAAVAWTIVSMTVIFVADCLTPIGIPLYIAYLIPVYISTHSRKRFGLLTTFACTVLMFLSLLPARNSLIPTYVAVINRVLVTAALWGAAFVQMYRTSLDVIRRRFAIVAANAADIAIISVTTDGKILDWNIGAEQLFGWTEKEVVGRNMEIFFTPEDREAGAPLKEREEAHRTGRGMDDRWQQKKDGSRFWANGVVLPLDDNPDSDMVKIIRDMTERRRMMDELSRQLEDLQRSNRDLEQFSYVAAHDLKAPLRTVGTYGELLQRAIDEGNKEKVGRYLQSIDRATVRMRGLIDDLLAFARAGGAALRITPVPLDGVIDEIRQNLRSAIRDNFAVVRAHQLPTIFADRSQMVQLFQNLIANAIKYRSPERPPEIEITAGNISDGWEILVKDNGAGISAEDRERIFEPFQSGSTSEGGSGIGLAICRRIAERHGGRVSLESEVGKGSTFTVMIPRLEVAAVPLPAK